MTLKKLFLLGQITLASLYREQEEVLLLNVQSSIRVSVPVQLTPDINVYVNASLNQLVGTAIEP